MDLQPSEFGSIRKMHVFNSIQNPIVAMGCWIKFESDLRI
uniref:Uncharacterized protein n=1 Tax=Nelumbo nucifera TaxID=4432 RepID=A0A822ZN78_NELNU|nr:TPA_asm: hypothetical protein HUJ06_017391 [Nelumbo nucifera]